MLELRMSSGKTSQGILSSNFMQDAAITKDEEYFQDVHKENTVEFMKCNIILNVHISQKNEVK